MKLMTKAIAGGLYKADAAFLESDGGNTSDKIIVKYFTPWAGATWFVVSATPLDAINGEPCEPADAKDWHLYGFADLGLAGCEELGYTLLSELEKLKGPWGLKVERDLGYTGSLKEVMSGYRRAA